MKSLYIVANWKENKTEDEVLEFIREFAKIYHSREDVEVVICPSYVSLSVLSGFVKSDNLQFEVGVQDISKFEEGAHTGEVGAEQTAELAKYVIIGHSERRKLGESDDDVAKKTEIAIKNNLVPIVCVVSENVPVPRLAKIVAYEPIEAIGTGHPDTPKNAEKVAMQIKSKNPQVTYVLYGGSVTAENVNSFTGRSAISGVLVGGASLNPNSFSSIIQNA